MDIMNELPPRKFEAVDDLLAFTSIYDDEKRIIAFKKLLKKNEHLIKDAVCLEAGCGFGLFAEYMAELGAKIVYAVEVNPNLYEIACDRLAPWKNIHVIHSEICTFRPHEQVDVLVHELFGQLLYDEDIHALNDLRFTPKHVFPNQAKLMGRLVNSADYLDETVTPQVLEKLDGCLISGLFDDEDIELEFPVVGWQFGGYTEMSTCDLKDRSGDLLVMGLHIYHENEFICQAGDCSNWSMVWTPRTGDKFSIAFHPTERGTETYFSWIK